MEIKGFQKVVPFENVTATATIENPESYDYSFYVDITYYFKDSKQDSWLEDNSWIGIHSSGENLLTDFEDLFGRKPEEITHIHLNFKLSGKPLAEMVRKVDPRVYWKFLDMLNKQY